MLLTPLAVQVIHHHVNKVIHVFCHILYRILLQVSVRSRERNGNGFSAGQLASEQLQESKGVVSFRTSGSDVRNIRCTRSLPIRIETIEILRAHEAHQVIDKCPAILWLSGISEALERARLCGTPIRQRRESF